MADFPWRALLRGVTAAEREHRRRADELWRNHDVIAAVRERGIADGLEEARDIHARVVAEARAGEIGADPLDGAMYSVWQRGEWRWLTEDMDAEEREAAADAVQRHSDQHSRARGEEPAPIVALRWWSE